MNHNGFFALITKPQILFLAFVVIFACIVWVAADMSEQSPKGHSPTSVSERPTQEPAESLPKGWARIGGVLRPETDVPPGALQTRLPASNEAEATNDDRKANPYGKQPLIDKDANPSVRAAYEAVSSNAHAEQIAPMFQPSPFSRTEYHRNRTEYLNKVEPGRVFHPSQPGEGVPVLRPVASTRQTMKQGESLRLSVKAVPGDPVTFTSFDLGAFENQLTSISVEANDDGLAQAVFTAPPGTLANVAVLAASPTSSGTVRFVVKVTQAQLP